MRVALDPKNMDVDFFNTIWITLDATGKSPLKWNEEVTFAKQCIKRGKKLFFHLDFGLHEPSNLSSETTFFSLILAIDHFSKMYQEFKAHIAGICLLKTDLEFYQLIDWDLELMQELKHVFLDVPFKNIHDLLNTEALKFRLNFFSSQLIANLLNLLLSQLPSGLEAIIFVDSKWKNLSQCYQLLSQYVFQNFSFAVKGLPIGKYQWTENAFYKGCFLEQAVDLVELSTHNTVGFLVSKTPQFLDKESVIKDITSKLQKFGVSLFVIEEEQFAQNWQELEIIIGFKSLFSENAERQMKGFLAAAGIFYNLDQKEDIDALVAFVSKELSLKATKLKDLSKQALSKYLPSSKQ